MRASWKSTIIAEAPKGELIRIEGNWYFPPRSLKKEYFQKNNHHTLCYWKGTADYFDIKVNGDTNESGAWYYPKPKDGSIERVKKDFSDYVAFWNGIEIDD
jgi:uncharacterized protein (DUF427 family)